METTSITAVSAFVSHAAEEMEKQKEQEIADICLCVAPGEGGVC